MSFEADYRTALLAYAPLAAVVGQRVGIRLAQETVFPSVRFQRIATERLYTQGGRNVLCVARVQNDCWSNDNAQALSIGDLLIRALDGINLASGSGKPNFILNQWFDIQPEPEPVLYRAIIEARIFFTDSA